MKHPDFSDDKDLSLHDIGEICYYNARDKGFYRDVVNPKDPIWLSNRLMLIVSELAEALEAVRDNNFSGIPESGGFIEELADACIRIFDLSYSIRGDLDKAISAKIKYNRNRPYRHGDKAI